MAAHIDGFEPVMVDTAAGAVFVQCKGSGAPLLLLHGFPETGMIWRDISPMLAADHAVIVADLPGYGRSACPADAPGHAAMSKRAMAATLMATMRATGHEQFAVIGHDRGGRVAYRMALGHPDRVAALAVLDIVPTLDVWDRERLIGAAPEAIIDDALTQWGSSPATFPPWLRDHYVDALRDPANVHAICEEYRAAATIDRHHDRADRAAGHRIACPVLALWSNQGALAEWYADVGGPLGLWQHWAPDVRGQPIAGGHFFPEEQPVLTAQLLADFLTAAR